MGSLGYGQGYEYAHDAEGGFVAARNLPEALGNPSLYEPSESGAEAETAAQLRDWRQRREAARSDEQD